MEHLNSQQVAGAALLMNDPNSPSILPSTPHFKEGITGLVRLLGSSETDPCGARVRILLVAIRNGGVTDFDALVAIDEKVCELVLPPR